MPSHSEAQLSNGAGSRRFEAKLRFPRAAALPAQKASFGAVVHEPSALSETTIGSVGARASCPAQDGPSSAFDARGRMPALQRRRPLSEAELRSFALPSWSLATRGMGGPGQRRQRAHHSPTASSRTASTYTHVSFAFPSTLPRIPQCRSMLTVSGGMTPSASTSSHLPTQSAYEP